MEKRSKPPAWVGRSVPGKVMVAEALDDGRWLVLTRDEVALVAESGLQWRRPWFEVERGEWDGESHTLTVHWVGDATPVPLTTQSESSKTLPLAFREQVDASVVHVETERARGGGSLRGAVRRRPDGSLLVQVLGVGRLRPGPELEAQVDALEARLRDAVGL